MVAVRLYLEVKAREDKRSRLDEWIKVAEDMLLDVENVQLKCNKVSDPDPRPVHHLHVYDVMPNTAPSDQDEDHWIEERELIIVASQEDAF